MLFVQRVMGLGVWEGYLGGLGVIRLHVRQIEQRNTTGLSFVLSRILFFSEERGWHHSILIWLFLLVFGGINCKMSISYLTFTGGIIGNNSSFFSITRAPSLADHWMNFVRIVFFCSCNRDFDQAQHNMFKLVGFFFIVSFIGIDQNAIRFSLRNNMIQSNKFMWLEEASNETLISWCAVSCC